MSDYALMQTVPVSISAKTRDELTKAMVKNNLDKNRHFDYCYITYTGKEWVAWYFVPQRDIIKTMQAKKEAVKPKKTVKRGK